MSELWRSLAGIALVLVGAAGLIGSLLDIPLLLTIRPGWGSMKANTALGFLLSGAALWQVQRPASAGLAMKLGRACASAAALIGLFTLIEYAAGLNSGIDNLLFADSVRTARTPSPGRIPPNTAAAMLFGNAALLMLASATDRSNRLTAAGTLAILTLLLGLYGAAGYVGGV
ncbi:MAG: hypothetical protein SGJ20_05650, partial [Planctomycetota bacterium]|nr:hypothetical protein [Planctomycetota bacterium]